MAKKNAPKRKANSKPKPRQNSLPGMEDRAVAEIEGLAEQIDGLKKKRASAQKQLKDLEREMLVMMTKRHKKEYHHDQVHVWTEERVNTVRVKIGALELQDTAPEPEEVPEETEPEVEAPPFEQEEETEDEDIPGAVGA